jgi:Concanavalin A-like lectin/glucanases superfamily
MSNPIKYSTGSETLALKKGNFYVGTNDVNKGPTSSTGYFDGVTPSSNQYVIYYNKSGSNRIYYCTNGDQVYLITNRLKGQNLTTLETALNYIATQSDMMCTNINYEPIVTDGLVLSLDPGFIPSYTTSGTTWYNMSGTVNGTLINSPTFSTNDGGIFVLDGTDDYFNFENNFNITTGPFTIEYFAKPTSGAVQYAKIISKGTFQQPGWSAYFGRDPANNQYSIVLQYSNNSGGTISFTTAANVSLNVFYHVVYTRDTNNTLSTYLNGSFVRSSANVTANFTSSNSYVIGRSTIGAENFKGSVGVVRQYNRALTSAEVLQNYNAQKSRYGL